MSDAKITITAEDQASPKFADVSASAVDLGTTIEGVGTSAAGVSDSVTASAHTMRDALTDAFENPMGAVAALGSEIEQSLGPLGAVAGLGVAAIGGVTAAVVELGSKGAEIADVQHGFEQFAGSVDNATAILAAMRTGVQGTLDDFSLQTDALHLMSAGVQLTTGDFGTLTQASLVLAHEGFGTTTEILNDLTQAMITGRTRQLERMTGVIDLKAAEASYAETLGVNTAALSTEGLAEAKREAILLRLHDVVGAAGEQELSFKDRIDQMKTAMTNATDALEVAVATSPVLGTVLGAVGTAVTDAFGAHQVSTIQTLTHWIDQGAITLTTFADVGLTGVDLLSHGWSGLGVVVSGALSLITEGALLAVRAYEGVANLESLTSINPVQRNLFAQDAASAKAYGDQLQAMQKSFHDDAETALAATTAHTAFDDTITAGQQALEDLKAKMIAASESGVDATTIVNALGEQHAATSVQVGTHAAAQTALARAIKDESSPPLQDFMGTLLKLGEIVPTKQIAEMMISMQAWDAVVMREASPALADFSSKLEHLGEHVDMTAVAKLNTELQKVEDTAPGVTAALMSIGEKSKPSIQDYADAVGTAGMALLKLEDVATQLPAAIISAAAGGGNIGQTVGATAGKEVGKVAGDAIGKEIGGAVGAGVGSVIPVVGTIIGGVIGSAIGGAISSAMGPSQAEKDARTYRDAFTKQFGGTEQAIQPIEDELAQVGVTAEQAQKYVAAMLDAKTPAAFAAAMQPINAAIKQDTDTSTAVTSLTRLVTAFTSAGHVIPASLQAVLTSLSTMQGLTAQEQTAITNLATSSTTDFNSLSSEASTLGVSLAALGPEFEQGQLNQKAQATVQTIQDLANAGGNMGGILSGAASTFQGYVTEAEQYGTTLPQSMEPYIANLIQAGRLTDQNGVALTSITQVQFANTPLATGLDNINAAASTLAGTLARIPGLASAATGVSVPTLNTETVGSPVSMAGESYDLARPTRAVVGDNPFESESVLHASTVKDLVRSARGGSGSGGAAGSPVLHDEIRALRADLRQQAADFHAAVAALPIMMNHAMRGTR